MRESGVPRCDEPREALVLVPVLGLLPNTLDRAAVEGRFGVEVSVEVGVEAAGEGKRVAGGVVLR